MLGRKWKLVMLICALIIVGTVMVVQASSTDPGSEQDPLITKSYFDRYNDWQIVEMVPGQKMILDSGSQFIIRGGKAQVITTDLGGIPDLTAGVDLQQGQVIPPNHLILVPRDDGRGFRVVSDPEAPKAWILVRGPYTVSTAN